MLVLNYLKQTGQTNPEIEMRALQYVNVGYQRILTFECESGGFNWWEGNNPGNSILSAMAIMMLHDTKAVYDAIDEAVIGRAAEFLDGLQSGDGSWAAESHLHAGNESLGAQTLRTTCYISWAMLEGGFGQRAGVERALAYIDSKIAAEKDLYTMGLCANALAAANSKHARLPALLKKISAAALRKGGEIHWTQSGGPTLVSSRGPAADVEITALMALAFIRAGFNLGDVSAIVGWLVSTKDPQGNWGYNTQATVLALKTFIAAASIDTSDTAATVKVIWGDETLGSREFDNFNKDVVWQIEVPTERLATGGLLGLDFSGKGNLGYEVVSTHFVPMPAGGNVVEPLTIDVKYDSTEIKVDDTVAVNVHARSNDAEGEGMVLLTLGIPPGFDVLTEDLDKAVQVKNARAGRRGARRPPRFEAKLADAGSLLTTISSYELTGRQLLLYLDSLPRDGEFELTYRLRARYPVRAQTGSSEARFYYQADKRGVSPSKIVEAR